MKLDADMLRCEQAMPILTTLVKGSLLLCVIAFLSCARNDGESATEQAQEVVGPSAERSIGFEMSWCVYIDVVGYHPNPNLSVLPSGDIIVTCVTETGPPGQYGNPADSLVYKLSASGEVLWSASITGSKKDMVRGVATDDEGNIFVAGLTASSTDFAVAGDVISGASTNGMDAFVLKLDSSGAIRWLKRLGGEGDDLVSCIAVGDGGSIYLAGYTQSLDFPSTIGTHDPRDALNGDIFVAGMTADGTVTWAAVLGGNGMDNPTRMVVDANGDLVVTGASGSLDFPAIGGNWRNSGEFDIIVFRMSPSGQLLWGTYLGGSDMETSNTLWVDSDAAIYVAGDTGSRDYPVKDALQPKFESTGSTMMDWRSRAKRLRRGSGGLDGVLTKLTPDGVVAWSTFFGGPNRESIMALCGDGSNTIYVAGGSSGTGGLYGIREEMDFGRVGVYLFALKPEGRPLGWTVAGGPGIEYCSTMVMSSTDSIVMSGSTTSPGISCGARYFERDTAGPASVFVSKILVSQ